MGHAEIMDGLRWVFDTSEKWHDEQVESYNEQGHINDLLSAAQFYGQMNGAAMAAVFIGSDELQKRMVGKRQPAGYSFKAGTLGLDEYTGAMFTEAKHEYNFYAELYRKSNNPDDLIAAAQYYGKMCALASMRETVLKNADLMNEIQGGDFKLYPREYDNDELPFN